MTTRLQNMGAAAMIDPVELTDALQTRVTIDDAGLMIGVIDGDERHIISVGGTGRAEDSVLDKESLFEIGSITKTFTGILLADMALKGVVALDDPVAAYVPASVTIPARKGQEITLAHLAMHTSGLPPIPDNFHPADATNPYADYGVQDMYDFLSGHALTRDIGAVAEYSNLGMGLLGHVLALKAEMSYEALVTKHILKPLGMTDTGIALNDAQQQRFVIGHDDTGAATGHWDVPTIAGAGALRSTMADMMIYLAANMGLTETPLTPAIEMSHRVRREFGAEDQHIGLAWLTEKTPEHTVIWHNGGTGGFRSYIAMDIGAKRGVVVLASYQDDTDLIGDAILADQIESLVMVPTAPVADAQKFVGDYELAPNFILTISAMDDGLFAQATGQPKAPVFAKSENEFFFQVADASLTFVEDDGGEIGSLILHQNGDHPAVRIR